MISRRTLLRGLGSSLALAAGAGFYTWRIEPHRLEIVRRTLGIAGLPAGLVGRSLVQLSDLHVGLQVDDDYLRDTFARVAALAPEIVVVTGDIISHHAGSFAQLDSLFRDFPHGSLATVAVLGNHDYGARWSEPWVADRVTRVLEDRGLLVLRNRAHDVAGLRILGLDDLWAGRFVPEQLADALSDGAPAIALSHNPDTVDRAGWGSYAGWILSGHTHGGQCKPPFLPPPFLAVRNRRYTAGEFALEGGRRLYVSRGVGHLTRVRFNVRPEVTVFELRREASRFGD